MVAITAAITIFFGSKISDGFYQIRINVSIVKNLLGMSKMEMVSKLL